MRSKVLGILLAMGLLGAVASGAMAQGVDSTAAKHDSTAVKADSTMMKSTTSTPAPAAAAPVTTTPAPAQTPPPAAAPAAAAPAAKKSRNDKIYFGGTVTVNFGSTNTVGFFPMMGYKLTPKISGGVEVGYEYISYDNGHSTHNYGGSVFGRYRVGRSLYAHVEYQTFNYEIFSTPTKSSREWVPALLVGGGIIKPIAPRTSAYAEVLFDVLQDDNSPYNSWDPVVNIGVAVGF
jgi:hypothetical protein